MASRRCMIARGSRARTRAEALRVLAPLASESVLWVSGDAPTRFVHTARPRELLGRAFDAVAIDLHEGTDADVLGQCHGLIWRGGTLLLRMPIDPPPHPALAAYPFTPSDAGTRFWRRLEDRIAKSDALTALAPIVPASHEASTTDDQARAIAELAAMFTRDPPEFSAILADRGRGKSSALGLALREACSRRPLRAAITGPSEGSVIEVLRFAPEGLCFTPALELARSGDDYDAIVVDEAAQLPVPLLRELARRHERARIAFASTVHGYEGTGRGFSLRFLAWAERHRTLSTLTLRAPIRYDDGDPLERLIFDALALDADPARDVREDLDPSELDQARLRKHARLGWERDPALPVARQGSSKTPPVDHVRFDRDALASDERTLRELFGLLVHAHYRTTPGDLHRMLDAPNLDVHALLDRGHVVAASLVAHEGSLPDALSRELARGETRVRGHALADTLICHADRPDAGALSMVRSVRIAVHPAVRRRGIARALVERIHESYAPDLFGTIFGATPELIAFRRALGYELVRVGVARGARTGEPAAVMVRPVTDRARALVSELRVELARNLPLQLELMDAEGELGVEPGLADALREGLPAPPISSEDEVHAIVESYLTGPRPYESAAHAIARFVEENAAALDRLAPNERALIEGRILQRHVWSRAARDAGYPSVPAAMRALRRAIRSLAAVSRS